MYDLIKYNLIYLPCLSCKIVPSHLTNFSLMSNTSLTLSINLTPLFLSLPPFISNSIAFCNNCSPFSLSICSHHHKTLNSSQSANSHSVGSYLSSNLISQLIHTFRIKQNTIGSNYDIYCHKNDKRTSYIQSQ